MANADWVRENGMVFMSLLFKVLVSLDKVIGTEN